jgi:cell division protein FtsW
VLVLFGVLAYVGLRIASRSADPFLRLVTATVTVWLVGQAIINIGYVVGLLPVTGVTLPLISSGGTSTAVTMFVFGLLANAARHEPQAIAAMRTGGQGRFAKLLLPSRTSCGQRRGCSASNLRAACRSNVAGKPASRHEDPAHAAPNLFAAFATGSGRRRARRSLCCLWWLATTTPGPRGTWVSRR